MTNLITQTDFANIRGCTKQYISKLVTQGVITLTEGKIDPIEAERQIKAHSDPTHARNRQKNTEADAYYKKSQLKKINFDMQLNKLRCEIREGKWVPKAIAEKKSFEEGRIIRDSIMRLSDRYEVAFANPKTREKTRAQIAEEIKNVINESKKRYFKFLHRQAQLLAKKEVSEDEY